MDLWWNSRSVSRSLSAIGLGFVGVSALLSAVRAVASGAWLPSGLGVLWFSFAEMFLFPSGVVLVLLGQLIGRFRQRQELRSKGPRTTNRTRQWRAVPLLVAVAVMGAVYLADRAVIYPRLSRKLEWGRYGLGEPVRLTRLDEVGRITSLWFPRQAVLLDGEYLGGLSQYLIARIAIPGSAVSGFLAQPPFLGEGHTEWRLSNEEMPQMVRRGWDLDSLRNWVSAQGIIRVAPESCWVTVSLDDPKRAIVYLYWQST